METPWADLSHAYGPADDIPGLLRAMESGGGASGVHGGARACGRYRRRRGSTGGSERRCWLPGVEGRWRTTG
ncbi:hypothetical protein [Streptomyces sp. CoH27]|uniref:hypothetical protein n=1 Tax=Streptomyces sp. CoH27 TaxID=2875763 RepID=UPI001CD5DE26|nr:hypothetical protein [Streptomyces sp. CoH27]